MSLFREPPESESASGILRAVSGALLEVLG